jgi:enoyl-CoA hydratase
VAKVELEARDDGVRLVTLTDPDRRNAMGDEMGAELLDAAREVAGDGDARALVVTGAGSAFCAGADLPAMFGDADRPVADTHAYLQGYYRAFLALRELAIPTVAAVNGPAVGAGLNLALACGVRIAGREATFGATFARIGLHPGGGCTHFLVEAIGPSRALRTLLLGDTLDAEQAVAWGLAEGPEDDPLGAALDLAGRFGQVEPALARHIVRAVRLAASTHDLDAVLEYESWAQAASASSPTLQAWVERFRKQ